MEIFLDNCFEVEYLSTMKTQSEIATVAGITQPFFANILAGRRRPSWKVSKRIAAATRTCPELWLEGAPEQMRAAIRAASDIDNQKETHGDPASIFEPRCCEHCAEGVNHEDQSSAATT